MFQSLTWVERLSDGVSASGTIGDSVFQSLTWVERLSDQCCRVRPHQSNRFQSLTWVERLSDLSNAPELVALWNHVSIPHLG